jgi:hypothetical protein
MEKETGTAPGHIPASLLLSPSQNLQPNRLEQLQQQESEDEQKALLQPQSQPQSRQPGVACSALVLFPPLFDGCNIRDGSMVTGLYFVVFFLSFLLTSFYHTYEMLMLCL